MSPETRERLKAFIGLVEKVERYPYFSGGSSIATMTLRLDGTEPAVTFTGPPDHDTDAVALRIRVLTHGDDLSIVRMGELCKDPGISQQWIAEYEQWAGAYIAKMRSEWSTGPSGTLTFRDAFDMALHGGRGHYKVKDKAFTNYQKHASSELGRQVLENTFHDVLVTVTAVAHNIAAASRDELIRAGDTA